MRIKATYWSIQELGKRSNQEDCIYPSLGVSLPDNDLFILCDGMGGHDCGEVASQTVCNTMSTYLNSHPDATFESALAAAYDALDAKDNHAGKKMGTTLALLKLEEGQCIVAHIGDSRVYQIRPSEKRIVYVTKDHSLVNELVDCGELTLEEAKYSSQKNIITRAMQPHQERRSKADVAILTDVKEGDYFFMCSDGMLEVTEDQDIVNILSLKKSDSQKVKILKAVTNENNDNHSAHLIRITSCVSRKVSANMMRQSSKSTLFVMALITVAVLGLIWYLVH